MEVSRLLLEVRSRLHDEKSEKWNDTEILDCINLAYINLARILRLFLQQREYKIQKDLVQDLPTNFLDIKNIQRDNKEIPILRAYQTGQKPYEYVSINNDKIIFNKTGNYIMTYYCYYIIVGKEDKLNITYIAHNALLFHALYLLLQKKPSANALQEVSFYKGLYENEIKELQRDTYRMHESRFLTSSYVLL
ncbi:phage adaptor protein [Helicobacter trogontum]|uniref:Uncharacterized protein n=1 Tax=Helicobacter trogontum TaxID=50960 RepID=A0A4U8SDP5_9HELI|nr:hypothetical protein [Helicobacter trogontum]TLD84244.1 hypothetical protein LS81_001910 [Helicobacter trogontum]